MLVRGSLTVSPRYESESDGLVSGAVFEVKRGGQGHRLEMRSPQHMVAWTECDWLSSTCTQVVFQSCDSPIGPVRFNLLTEVRAAQGTVLVAAP